MNSNKAKHTPGPWEARAFHSPQHSRYEVKDTIGNDIVLLDYEIGDENEGLPTNEQREADAALIAAAPDMLEALKNASGIVEQAFFAELDKHGWQKADHELPQHVRWLQKVHNEIQDAIDKATNKGAKQ